MAKNATTHKNVLTGPVMRSRLKDVGIEAQKVIRSRSTGYYVAEFFAPSMQSPVKPSREWAQTIKERVKGLKIIDSSDTVADWRADKPIIWASVTFEFDPPESA